MPSDLHRRLTSLDGKSYGAYKSLRGAHKLEVPRTRGTSTQAADVTLIFDKVQSDPYAPPSRARVRITVADLPFDGASIENPGHFSTAELDCLCRRLARAVGNRGLHIDRPGQQVLPRTAVTELHGAGDGRVGKRGDELQICLEIQLPARGRRIMGREAARLICEDLPRALADAIFSAPARELDAAASLEYDQACLRTAVAEAGLIGFIPDGAILPRRAGNSEQPKPGATPFSAPETLAHEFELPSGRSVRGMGIPRGVTLIVGGGYHGKSTLLSALVTGVYDHIEGDGRELVVADSTAVALRAEDGRAITGVDISPFINGLPSGDDTTRFSTTNASGSTSQAAGLVETLEVDCRVLLIDEDTSATNFMIRDERMRALVPDEREPITPLVARVRELWDEQGVSTVIVAGGSGAFIDVADTVIAMDSYQARDITERARALREGSVSVTSASATSASVVSASAFAQDARRFITAGRPGKSSKNGRPPKPPRARGRELIQYGRENLDLRAVSQIMDSSQTEAIARILNRVVERLDGSADLASVLAEEYADFCHSTFDDAADNRHTGRLACPRIHEVAAAINRLRNLRT